MWKKKKGKIKRSGMRWRKYINIHEMTVEGRHKRSGNILIELEGKEEERSK